MNLDSLRAYIAAADCGTWSDAAKRERLTPSTLKLMIGQLENEIGCLLVEPERALFVLTLSGHVFLNRARAAVCLVNQGVEEALVMTPVSPEISIGIEAGLEAGWLPLLMKLLTCQWNDFKIQIRLGTASQLADWVYRKDIDVAIVREKADSRLVYELIERACLDWRMNKHDPRALAQRRLDQDGRLPVNNPTASESVLPEIKTYLTHRKTRGNVLARYLVFLLCTQTP